ncbi:purine-nucleoside phosphorylase [Olsenella sp. KH3B4]|uniref:purine-nucleoside phosphorylase n=1 Tax=Olsenella sp. KH3B4 TaxID=1855394 RepID=UPI0008D7E1B0|nr:purine-nucleoside phosphorylase [Olsenella sp. KH3B4]SET07601.1 purine-nucleoside phosphorylase [Olsenella sp. KH3B4]
MAATPTPHNEAVEGQIAPFVLMPGDPLRAKRLAETYLEDVEQFNGVRNMLGYTGTYEGRPVSVMGSGMGMPSIGIYSYELFNFYGVESIVRIGTAGGVAPDVRLRDIVLGMGACTDSNYAHQFNVPGTLAPIADFGLLNRAAAAGARLGYPTRVGNVLSSDVFYNDDPTAEQRWAKMGVLAVEMESAALYLNAMRAHKRALTVLTVTDVVSRGEAITAEERQESLTQMMEVALSLALPE